MSPPTEIRSLIDPVPDIWSTRSAKSLVQDQGRGFRVIDDALDLGSREGRVQGDGLEPTFVRGQLPAEHVDVVGEGVGEDVAGTEALRARSAWTRRWARPASSEKVSVTPEGQATTAGWSGYSSARNQNPSRRSQGCFIGNRVYQ